jgi:hypothetical protein
VKNPSTRCGACNHRKDQHKYGTKTCKVCGCIAWTKP